MNTSFNDSRLRIWGPVVLFVFVALFFRLDWYLSLPLRTVILNDMIGLSIGVVWWQLARWVVLRLQARYSGYPNSRKRLVWLLVLLPIMANLAWFIRQMTRFLFDGHIWYFPHLVEYSRAVGMQFFYHCVYFSIYEGAYVLKEWQKAQLEKDALTKSNLQSQLVSLKNQVSPHFLFNSLNSISSLITEDPDQAEAFVDELASVYRYLLQAGERELTTLDAELTFIRSYFYLIKMRYGTGIDVSIDVDAVYYPRLLPPLTLQILIENALKHNIFLPEQPLRIYIQTPSDGTLRVENTIQRRNVRVETVGIGLANMAIKYKLLDQPTPVIDEQAGWFRVTLPLLTQAQIHFAT
ncbi:histidine kinase [Spirosoma sp. SC4-14]|uniref:sensor histidine kinase n=1 Tax=Spirosoma sp. SC4-14 TaxID=3128900 RepID=UPI0030CD1272